MPIREANEASEANETIGAQVGQVIDVLQRRSVVVVGDLMLDKFVHGQVNRISPEAPIPIFARINEILMPGGAANVARNLVHLGAHVTLIGLVGDDRDAEDLAKCLADTPQITTRIITDPARKTTVKTRFTTEGQQILRVDNEDNFPADPATQKKLIAAITEALNDAEAVIFSDYNKGVVDRKTIQTALDHPNRAKIHILADPKQSDIQLYSGIDLLKPNFNELRIFCPNLAPHAPPEAIFLTVKNLITQAGIGAGLITLGADGMALVSPKGEHIRVKSDVRSVFDVSGAGDTVIATIAAALTAKAPMETAVIMANTAAGIAVSKAGTATCSPGEMMGRVGAADAISLDQLTALAEEWRQERKAITFTNGCFDCLHPGHIWLLREAARTGDRLVVGLNSDASTRRLKSSGRPIQPEHERIAALNALPFVDAVVVFDDDTPKALIETLTPDILVKGGDYSADQLSGGKHVKQHGGKVVIIPTMEGFSTTQLSDQPFY